MDNPEQQQPRFIGIKEFSWLMGQSESRSRAMVANGEIRFVRSGKRILIPSDEPERILKEIHEAFCVRREATKNSG